MNQNERNEREETDIIQFPTRRNNPLRSDGLTSNEAHERYWRENDFWKEQFYSTSENGTYRPTLSELDGDERDPWEYEMREDTV